MQTLDFNAEHLAKGAHPLFENCHPPVVAGSSFFTVSNSNVNTFGPMHEIWQWREQDAQLPEYKLSRSSMYVLPQPSYVGKRASLFQAVLINLQWMESLGFWSSSSSAGLLLSVACKIYI